MRVFYSEKQQVSENDSSSPSAGKPAQVIKSWQALSLPIELMPVELATREEFHAVHDATFVDDILECREENGFNNRLPAVAASLPWTSGSMRSAAAWVVQNGGFACSPTSGFHHANYASCGGYCTFNGLMVAAMSLHAQGLARKVGILDCDQHYGNGTDNIIKHLGVDWIHHWTFGGQWYSQGAKFIASLPGILKGFEGCDVVLYQAGADPHVKDPLGGCLTTKQLLQRDELVFQHFAKTRTPLAWNLAGGYQRDAKGGIRPVLDIHDNTARACIAAS